MRSEPLDQGVSRSYSASLKVAVDAARSAMIGAGIGIEEVKEVDANTWMILGKKGTSAWSWGELVRVVVQEQAADSTVAVRIITKRRLATNITAKGDWSDSILDQIDLQLKQ